MKTSEKRREAQRRYRRTKRGMLTSRYQGMKRRVKEQKSYIGLPVMSKDDFLMWSFNDTQFHNCYNMWVKHDYHKYFSPSVHRKDPSKGYIKGNVEWMPLRIHLIRDTHRIPIAGICPKTYEIKYTLPSISSAREFGFCPTTILKTMSDKYPKHKTVGGLVWRKLTT